MKKRIFLVTLLVTLAIVSIGSSAFALPFNRENRTKKSNFIVVGDSRVYYTYKTYKLGTATTYSAQVGGTYNGKGLIISGDRKGWIKNRTIAALKKYGSARLVFQGTINEVANGQKDNSAALRKLAKQAHGWTAKFSYKENGKTKTMTVRPTVYVTEALSLRTGALQSYVNQYNNNLKKGASAGKYTYLNLPNPKSSDYCDNAHFHKAFSRKVHNFIKDKTDKVIPVTKVTLNKTSLSLVRGKTFQLQTTIVPGNSNAKTITWSTSNKNIAKVSAGKVTAINPGTATITAKSKSGKTATCKVSVKEATVAQ